MFGLLKLHQIIYSGRTVLEVGDRVTLLRGSP